MSGQPSIPLKVERGRKRLLFCINPPLRPPGRTAKITWYVTNKHHKLSPIHRGINTMNNRPSLIFLSHVFLSFTVFWSPFQLILVFSAVSRSGSLYPSNQAVCASGIHSRLKRGFLSNLATQYLHCFSVGKLETVVRMCGVTGSGFPVSAGRQVEEAHPELPSGQSAFTIKDNFTPSTSYFTCSKIHFIPINSYSCMT